MLAVYKPTGTMHLVPINHSYLVTLSFRFWFTVLSQIQTWIGTQEVFSCEWVLVGWSGSAHLLILDGPLAIIELKNNNDNTPGSHAVIIAGLHGGLNYFWILIS